MFRLITVTTIVALTGAAMTTSAAEITGRVVDRLSGEPVAGAAVLLEHEGGRSEATSSADGGFALALPEPPPATARLMVTADGYRSVDRTVADPAGLAELVLDLSPTVFAGEIRVTGLRATPGETPVTVSTIEPVEIERRYWAQDLPIFLEATPGFYAYNDSGSGIGYSYYFLRGFDMRRTAVNINGVPLNDAHSHGVFFVDLADFLSTTGEIQVQRGVGVNLYGGSAIGGSVDIRTRPPLPEPRLRVAALAGSFGTSRFTLEYDSGLFDDRWAATARYSRVRSDGYRDQSWTEMWNYYLSVVRYGERTSLSVNLFGGPEETHLAYEGIPRAYLDGEVTGDERVDRRFNPLTYPNEIDSFFQPRYQVVHSWQIAPGLVWQNTVYLFEGDGYFQQFKAARWMPEYRLEPFALPDGTIIDSTDLVRRREVDEWDAGWIPNLEWQHGGGRGSLQAGAAIRLHSGRHWGFVQWAQFYPPGLPPDHRYYDYRLDKRTLQPFVQEHWRLSDRVKLMAGLTWTSHRYEMRDDRIAGVEVESSFSYLLPRLGVTVRPNDRLSLFANISRGAREPAFRDIYDPQSYWTPPPQDLDPEKLTDYELGATYGWTAGRASLNLYYLDFDNAIVWAGGLDNNGDPVTANGAVTEHLGAELDLEWSPLPDAGLRLGVAWTRAEIVEFVEFDFSGNAVDHSGNRLPVTPEWMASLELWGEVGLAAGTLTVRWVDEFYLDNTQDMRRFPEVRDDPGYVHRVNDAYLVLDLGVRVDLGDAVARALHARDVAAELRVNNLTDQLYTTFGYVDGGEPLWIPAATRNAYVGLVFDW